MHLILFEIPTSAGPLQVPAYGLLVTLGFCAAFVYAHVRVRRIGIQPERLLPIYAAAAAGGLLGARLLYALAVEPGKTLSDPASLLQFTGGFAIYGGVIGGAVAVIGAMLAMRLPPWKLADIFAPALLFGMGIGRVGCFFAGCCNGAEVDLLTPPNVLVGEGFLDGRVLGLGHFPWLALEFHGGMSSVRHAAVYPTQVWQAVGLTGFATLLAVLWSRRRFDGQIVGLWLLIEPVMRIIMESYRADERGYAVSWAVERVPAWLPPGFSQAGEVAARGAHHLVVGITTSQFIGVAMMLLGAGILVARRNAGVAPEKPLDDEV